MLSGCQCQVNYEMSFLNCDRVTDSWCLGWRFLGRLTKPCIFYFKLYSKKYIRNHITLRHFCSISKYFTSSQDLSEGRTPERKVTVQFPRISRAFRVLKNFRYLGLIS